MDHPLVYATLLPIIGGVGLASLKELSFTWTALIAASAANQAAALKVLISRLNSVYFDVYSIVTEFNVLRKTSLNLITDKI